MAVPTDLDQLGLQMKDLSDKFRDFEQAANRTSDNAVKVLNSMNLRQTALHADIHKMHRCMADMRAVIFNLCLHHEWLPGGQEGYRLPLGSNEGDAPRESSSGNANAHHPESLEGHEAAALHSLNFGPRYTPVEDKFMTDELAKKMNAGSGLSRREMLSDIAQKMKSLPGAHERNPRSIDARLKRLRKFGQDAGKNR